MELNNIDDPLGLRTHAGPDRSDNRQFGFLTSGSGDADAATSASGPSRSSTPFYGESAGEGTDYESAYGGDAVIPMNPVGDHFEFRGPSPVSQKVPRGEKTAHLRIGPDDGRDSRGVANDSNRTSRLGRWSAMLGLGDTRLLKGNRYEPLDRQSNDAYYRSPKSPETPLSGHSPYSHGTSLAWQHHHRQLQFNMAMLKSPRQLLACLGLSIQSTLASTHPAKVFLALLFIAGFIASTTLLIIYILNPDKEPKPWRTFCANSPTFPHDLADSLAPVDVFVGVMTLDAKFERRSIIRQTYAAHTLPIDPVTGHTMSNVQVKFVMGKPRKPFERRIALEMEMYNDIVILDVKENMNGGKTHAFFRWAAENATVPMLRPTDQAQEKALADFPHVVHASDDALYQVAWKKADYVVKADDDAFLVLSELERHLRVAPRRLTYWGYLIRNWFMGGEAYALSADLVSYVARSPNVAAHITGKEDKVTSRWMRMHPLADRINYVSERCWMYDHPKSGTAYAHGFLFPDQVRTIKHEAKVGISEEETRRRGGPHASQWYSTISHWHKQWSPPRPDMSVEEEIEALTEGGGIYAPSGFKNLKPVETTGWREGVYEANDRRLQPSHSVQGRPSTSARLRAEWSFDASSFLPVYGTVNISASDAKHRIASHGVRSYDSDEEEIDQIDTQAEILAEGEDEEEKELLDSNSVPSSHGFLSHLPIVGALKHFAAVGRRPSQGQKSAPYPSLSTSHDETDPWQSTSESNGKRESWGHKHDASPQSPTHPERLVVPQSASVLPYAQAASGFVTLDDLRRQRYAHSETHEKNTGSPVQPATTLPLRGGTVVVHFLKRNEWFYETALALIGRDKLRGERDGRQWSMYGSPSASHP